MSTKRFPTISIAVTVVLAVVLTASNTIYERYCAFGFGGFQCNDPVSGYGSALITTSLVSIALLVVSAAIAVWKLIAWARS
ncbi:MAG: hypothetical protein EPO53_02605 [Variovorax sp.]|jgi:hypothetical protein|uniref:hypothetical protein n=1 Tax=Variovorax sp. TaxID=1871043 RepID=UPI00120EB3E6|nr:MAG: hypothetical protein EPO53_02605 [Variovorax sp.]